MSGGTLPVPFRSIGTIQDVSARLVVDGDKFKPASGGSLGGKIVNWLKETFRPALIKRENAAAYDQAKKAYLAQGGDAGLAKQFFDARVGGGVAFTPADIKGLHERFSQDRVDWLGDRIRDNVDPSKLQGTMADLKVADGRGFHVAQTFGKDVCRGMRIAIEGDSIIDAAEDHDPKEDASDALFSFCTGMQRAGFDADDIAAMSRLMNQSTLGIFMEEHFASNTAKQLELPDGQQVIPLPTGGTTQSYNIIPRDDGVELRCTNKGQLGTISSTDGTTIHLHPKSDAKLDFTLLLKRDQGGTLVFDRMLSATSSFNAFDTAGKRLS